MKSYIWKQKLKAITYFGVTEGGKKVSGRTTA